MDVMPLYIIDRKFPDTSGKSLTYPSASYNPVPSVRLCVRVFLCMWLGDKGQHAQVDHASPLGIPDVQQEMGS